MIFYLGSSFSGGFGLCGHGSLELDRKSNVFAEMVQHKKWIELEPNRLLQAWALVMLGQICCNFCLLDMDI